ncbi:MAG TPA: alcohol dehydrogenase catalytic domain-containing protein [Terriglobia bacterium]|nr:alcohol dehydrogenase catalytic domain-containing protein [Terriglobia bacterium]
MKAAILEDVQQLVVRRIPDPALSRNEVMIQVQAVGVCGTDLHLFRGHGNYNLDTRGRIIPLQEQPQILGHEFSGKVVDVGRSVMDVEVGDRVLCDQGRNCFSQEKWPLCSYCASGDSHQCEHYREHGITGLQGALAEFIAMPAVNCLKLPGDLPTELGALVEPLGCVVHSCERVDRAGGRYSFAGQTPIQNVLICGAGPAGLLFLQYLRKVKRFEGLILISDVRQKNLELAREFGGTPINVAEEDLPQAVQDRTRGERIHYLIESCGNSVIFEQMPSLLRKQATVLLYGHGHKGRDIGLWGNVLYLEPTLVASVGASGGFEADGRPATYRRALELVSSGQIRVEPFVTHRYSALEDIHQAFENDFQRPEYIKGVLNLQ